MFAYLHSVDSHPTAEQVFAAVRPAHPQPEPGHGLQGARALVDAGLAARLADNLGGPVRYDGRPQPHYHLRCDRTGQVRDLALPYAPDLLDRLAPELVEELRRQGFEIRGHRLEILGHFRQA